MSTLSQSSFPHFGVFVNSPNKSPLIRAQIPLRRTLPSWSNYISKAPSPNTMTYEHAWVRAHSVKSNSLQPHGLQPTRLLCPWDSPGKKTGVGCHFLLQSIAEWLTNVLLWSWSFSWTLYLLSTFLLHTDTLSSLTIASWVHLTKLFIFFLIKDCEENTTPTTYFSFTFKKIIYFIWLCQVLVIACRSFSSAIWDLVPLL